MPCSKGVAWLLAATLLLAACQPPPRPFATDKANPLLDAPESAGLIVEPLAGLPSDVAQELQAAVTQRLQESRILASTGPGNRASLRLKGEGSLAGNEVDGSGRAYINWVLLDADGGQLAAFASTPNLRPGRVADDNGRVLDSITRQVAESLETSRLAARHRSAAPIRASVPVTVLPVEGAPGDGREALRRGLQAMLRNLGVRVASDIDADGVLVYGDVTVTPSQAGREQVDMQWVVRWADGTEVGRVSQSNEIPAGLLRRNWGPIALAAAEGAAAGIAELVRLLATRPPPAPAAAPPPGPPPVAAWNPFSGVPQP